MKKKIFKKLSLENFKELKIKSGQKTKKIKVFSEKIISGKWYENCIYQGYCDIYNSHVFSDNDEKIFFCMTDTFLNNIKK